MFYTVVIELTDADHGPVDVYKWDKLRWLNRSSYDICIDLPSCVKKKNSDGDGCIKLKPGGQTRKYNMKKQEGKFEYEFYVVTPDPGPRSGVIDVS